MLLTKQDTKGITLFCETYLYKVIKTHKRIFTDKSCKPFTYPFDILYSVD